MAERKNKHVVETALTLLTAANMPGQFWYHSLAHAVYLINRMPSQSLKHQAPYFRLYGKQPELQSLRIFGTAQCHLFFFPLPLQEVTPRATTITSIAPSTSSSTSASPVAQLLRGSDSVLVPEVHHPLLGDHHLPVLPPLEHSSSASFSPQWKQAMQEEIDALHMQGTWSLVPNPGNKNIVGSKWIYKIKRNSDGSIARHKAWLVAQGFSQEQGLDFSETFSPIVRHTTIRLILSLDAMNKWQLRQLDVKNAFLHGELEEEVFMKQPQGFADPRYPDFVCKLKKSLYGLKQAPRAWNAKFTRYLPAIGFQASQSDPSLFVRHSDSEVVILLLYVDDIILTGSNEKMVQLVIDELRFVFEMKDLGKLKFFLGLQVSYASNGDIVVNQSKYAKELLHKAGMHSCRSCSTPCKPHTQVLKESGEVLTDPTLFRSIVGALQYLTFTRPDLAYSVNSVCQYMNQPTDLHWHLVKRILKYVQGTLEYGLSFTTGDMHLSAYSDADWAGDINTRIAEAWYRALANTTADLAWIRQVLKDLKLYLPDPPVAYCDNLSTLTLSSNPVYHSRIKHLDIDFHFVRERVQKKDLLV
ncbi:unnamed protein product [Prunus armeniaca]